VEIGDLYPTEPPAHRIVPPQKRSDRAETSVLVDSPIPRSAHRVVTAVEERQSWSSSSWSMRAQERILEDLRLTLPSNPDAYAVNNQLSKPGHPSATRTSDRSKGCSGPSFGEVPGMRFWTDKESGPRHTRNTLGRCFERYS
jgi:hypothetical protein